MTRYTLYTHYGIFGARQTTTLQPLTIRKTSLVIVITQHVTEPFRPMSVNGVDVGELAMYS